MGKLSDYIRDHLPFPRGTWIVPGTLDHLRAVLARELPCAIDAVVTHARVDGVPLGTIEITIREGTGNPTPAVTKDTVVTLGMLREIAIEGFDVQRAFGGKASGIGYVIEKKLAGK